MFDSSGSIGSIGTGTSLATTTVLGGGGGAGVIGGTYQEAGNFSGGAGCVPTLSGTNGLGATTTTFVQNYWPFPQPYPCPNPYPIFQFWPQPWYYPVPYYAPLPSPVSPRLAAALEVLKLVTDADDTLRKAAVAVLLAELAPPKTKKRRARR